MKAGPGSRTDRQKNAAHSAQAGSNWIAFADRILCVPKSNYHGRYEPIGVGGRTLAFPSPSSFIRHAATSITNFRPSSSVASSRLSDALCVYLCASLHINSPVFPSFYRFLIGTREGPLVATNTCATFKQSYTKAGIHKLTLFRGLSPLSASFRCACSVCVTFSRNTKSRLSLCSVFSVFAAAATRYVVYILPAAVASLDFKCNCYTLLALSACNTPTIMPLSLFSSCVSFFSSFFSSALL